MYAIRRHCMHKTVINFEVLSQISLAVLPCSLFNMPSIRKSQKGTYCAFESTLCIQVIAVSPVVFVAFTCTHDKCIGSFG